VGQITLCLLGRLGWQANLDDYIEKSVLRPAINNPSVVAITVLPRQVWEQVRRATIAEKKSEECKPLLFRLKIALMRVKNGVPSMLGSPTVPVIDVSLLRHGWEFLARGKPTLDPSVVAQQLSQIVT